MPTILPHLGPHFLQDPDFIAMAWILSSISDQGSDNS